MPEDTLTLKRDPDAKRSEGYDVLFEARHGGCIYKAVSHAPSEAPWFWGSGPQYGQVATLRAGVPRRMGSQAKGARKKLGVADQQLGAGGTEKQIMVCKSK